MCGIPASGKTTYVKNQIEMEVFPKTAFILNPDIVMERIEGYQKDKLENGAEHAFRKWEIPARTLAYKLFLKAQALEKTIIIDMGCAREENYQMLLSLKEAGYKIFMTYIKCSIDTAIERSQKRDRFTPPDMIYKRFHTLEALIPRYQDIAYSFTEIETS